MEFDSLDDVVAGGSRAPSDLPISPLPDQRVTCADAVRLATRVYRRPSWLQAGVLAIFGTGSLVVGEYLDEGRVQDFARLFGAACLGLSVACVGYDMARRYFKR